MQPDEMLSESWRAMLMATAPGPSAAVVANVASGTTPANLKSEWLQAGCTECVAKDFRHAPIARKALRKRAYEEACWQYDSRTTFLATGACPMFFAIAQPSAWQGKDASAKYRQPENLITSWEDCR